MNEIERVALLIAEKTAALWSGWDILPFVLRLYDTIQLNPETTLIAASALTVAILWAVVGRRIPDRDMHPGVTLREVLIAPAKRDRMIILLFFGVGGVWACVAPLESAAVSNGTIAPEANRKIIRHLEGGVIKTIAVQERDFVEAGAPLVTLESVVEEADLAEIRAQIATLVATEARLKAEQSGAATVTFPDEVRSQLPDQKIADLFRSQEDLLKSRQREIKEKLASIEHTIQRLEAQNAGLKRVRTTTDRQLANLEEELQATESLLSKGLVRRPVYNALVRSREELLGAVQANEAEIDANEASIRQASNDAHALTNAYRSEVSSLLTETRSELNTLRERVRSRENQLKQTVITSPVDGYVFATNANAEGTTIRPGDPIMEIVPTNEELVVVARVSPQDVDVVFPGLKARVVLSALNQRTMPEIFGAVKTVSADIMVDKETGVSYYQAQITVPDVELQKVGGRGVLTSGMPVSIMIVTGERSLARYLFEPLIVSFRASFREA